MCIYLINRLDLNYRAEEHIIPAAIGGKKKLIRGTVSDEFNNSLSRIELEFFRNSLYGVPRLFYGPGKRGSLNESKATKSVVHVIEHSDNSLSLAYLKLGQQIIVPQVSINVETSAFSVGFQNSDDFDYKTGISELKSRFEKWDALKIRILKDSNIPENIVLMGVEDGVEDNFNCFFAISANSSFFPEQKWIDVFLHGLQIEITDPKIIRDWPVSKMKSNLKTDYLRIFGKIAFNLLAEIMGADFVKASIFDPIRNWIVFGGENIFVWDEENSWNLEELLMIKEVQNFHIILLISKGSIITACISLYGMPKLHVRLTDNYQGCSMLDGFVCNWKEGKEMRLMPYLSEMIRSV